MCPSSCQNQTLCNNIYTDKDINKNEAFESLIRAENEHTEIDSLRTPQTQACTGRVSEISGEAVTAGMDGLVRAAELWRDWIAAGAETKYRLWANSSPLEQSVLAYLWVGTNAFWLIDKKTTKRQIKKKHLLELTNLEDHKFPTTQKLRCHQIALGSVEHLLLLTAIHAKSSLDA